MKSWRAIAFAPSEPDRVYAGTSAFFSAGTFDDRMPAAGIYVSQDGGASWEAANDTLSQDANVTDLVVHPQDPRLVYAASGNKGLLKTSNGGSSWQLINPPTRGGDPVALSVSMHPSKPDWIYLGLASGGLYRSRDSGGSWELASAGLNPEASITDILFDPAHPDVIYLSDVLSGVYRSEDSGDTWISINQELRTRAVNKLAFSADGAHLYAATEGEGVYRLDIFGTPPRSTPPTETPSEELTPSPIPPAEEPEVSTSPTATPSGGTSGVCGSAITLPLSLFLLIWSRRRR
jgi:uncharacterized protein (TIGR03382 family)